MHQKRQTQDQEQEVCFPEENAVRELGSNSVRTQQVSFSFPSNTVLRIGSRGALVKKLQEALVAQGSLISTDGIFGAGTHNAVRQYQRSKGLLIDGVAGQGTLTSLGGSHKQQEKVEVKDCEVKHIIFPGDSLWTIAQHYYGDGGRWKEIADANNLTSYSILNAGQELNIPNAPTQQVSDLANSPSPTPEELNSSGDVPSPTQAATTEHDENQAAKPQQEGGGMTPSDPIPLQQYSGLNRTMAEIYNKFGAYIKAKAVNLGISTAGAAGVLKCESGGEGFSDNGNMIIRFENHIFYDEWGKHAPQTFDNHFYGARSWKNHKFRRGANAPWESFHGNQNKEWEVLELARELNDTAALRSISMGAAQIMGFNHATVGYDTVQDMFDAMCTSLPKQLDGLFAFIAASNTCMRGLRNGDYTTFARGYNGPGQAQTYGRLISAASSAYANVTRGRESGS